MFFSEVWDLRLHANHLLMVFFLAPMDVEFHPHRVNIFQFDTHITNSMWKQGGQLLIPACFFWVCRYCWGGFEIYIYRNKKTMVWSRVYIQDDIWYTYQTSFHFGYNLQTCQLSWLADQDSFSWRRFMSILILIPNFLHSIGSPRDFVVPLLHLHLPFLPLHLPCRHPDQAKGEAKSKGERLWENTSSIWTLPLKHTIGRRTFENSCSNCFQRKNMKKLSKMTTFHNDCSRMIVADTSNHSLTTLVGMVKPGTGWASSSAWGHRKDPPQVEKIHLSTKFFQMSTHTSHLNTWVFPKMGGKPPKSSILIGFSGIHKKPCDTGFFSPNWTSSAIPTASSVASVNTLELKLLNIPKTGRKNPQIVMNDLNYLKNRRNNIWN